MASSERYVALWSERESESEREKEKITRPRCWPHIFRDVTSSIVRNVAGNVRAAQKKEKDPTPGVAGIRKKSLVDQHDASRLSFRLRGPTCTARKGRRGEIKSLIARLSCRRHEQQIASRSLPVKYFRPRVS